jgi:tRNA-splicing ligase RtcB
MGDPIKLNRISDIVWEIPRSGDMKVPCRIFASEELVEKMQQDRTLQQGRNMTVLPGIYKYSLVMPDGHEGYGFPIGGVAALDYEEGGISPGGIGYDINCGVRLLHSNLQKDEVAPRIKALLEKLFEYCPAGLGSSNIKVNEAQLDRLLNGGARWAVENGYGSEEDLKHCEENGCLEQADAAQVSNTAKKRGKKQIATLGSGNHFLEVQYVDQIHDRNVARAFGLTEEGQVTFMIHCGSRGLGHQVCSDFLRKMEKGYPDILKELPDRELIYAPAGSELAQTYFRAMCAAANFAWCNRHVLGHQTRLAVRAVLGDATLETLYDVAHNIAKVEEHKLDGDLKRVWMHRKGATRAFGPGRKEIPSAYRELGQPILIPGSMGTASYVLVGTSRGMEETFGSTAHGAGRAMSRHQAKKTFRGEEIARNLEERGIFVKGASWRGIAEEASGAYKDVDEVVRVSHEANIGNLVARLRPLGVVKG